MNLLKGVALVVALSAGVAARAQPLPIIGLGSQPCSMLFASKDDPAARRGYVSWALGLMSGIAIASQNGMLTGHNEDEIELRLLLACAAANPSTLVATAAMTVATDFIRRR